MLNVYEPTQRFSHRSVETFYSTHLHHYDTLWLNNANVPETHFPQLMTSNDDDNDYPTFDDWKNNESHILCLIKNIWLKRHELPVFFKNYDPNDEVSKLTKLVLHNIKLSPSCFIDRHAISIAYTSVGRKTIASAPKEDHYYLYNIALPRTYETPAIFIYLLHKILGRTLLCQVLKAELTQMAFDFRGPHTPRWNAALFVINSHTLERNFMNLLLGSIWNSCDTMAALYLCPMDNPFYILTENNTPSLAVSLDTPDFYNILNNMKQQNKHDFPPLFTNTLQALKRLAETRGVGPATFAVLATELGRVFQNKPKLETHPDFILSIKRLIEDNILYLDKNYTLYINALSLHTGHITCYYKALYNQHPFIAFVETNTIQPRVTTYVKIVDYTFFEQLQPGQDYIAPQQPIHKPSCLR